MLPKVTATSPAMSAVSAGPPPRALPQYPVRVHNGQVEILTSPIPIV